jgi:rhodanese-related sulfurtransferase
MVRDLLSLNNLMEDTMPSEIDRKEVVRLVESGARLIEVLPAREYEEEHLPRAINIPLKKLNRQTTAQLEQNSPVIVYCGDYQ